MRIEIKKNRKKVHKKYYKCILGVKKEQQNT